MRVLAVGAGGVGTSAALIAARRGFFEKWVVSDYDGARAKAVVDRIQDDRFIAAQLAEVAGRTPVLAVVTKTDVAGASVFDALITNATTAAGGLGGFARAALAGAHARGVAVLSGRTRTDLDG